MALASDDIFATSRSVKNSELFAFQDQLCALHNRLKKCLNYARRCCESFRTTHWKWSLLRLKINERLTYLSDVTRICAYELFVETATELLDDDLPQDREMIEELITIFNEYLNYAVDIKAMIEDTHSDANLSETIFSLAKERYPELLPGMKGIESMEEKVRIFDLVTVLEKDTAAIIGGHDDDVLSKTMELLRFLSFHWDIIGELTIIEQNRGPVQNINLLPDKFLDSVMWEEKKPTYYDLVSNLSVSSAVKCTVSALLEISPDEWLQTGNDKLGKLQKALDNRTKRIGLMMELLISET